jgi:hypothetical protein
VDGDAPGVAGDPAGEGEHRLGPSALVHLVTWWRRVMRYMIAKPRGARHDQS